MKKLLTLLIIGLAFANIAYTSSLSPEIKDKLYREGKLQEYYQSLIDYNVGGLSGPDLSRCPKTGLIADEATDTISILVLLVDFSDNPESGNNVSGVTTNHFDSILFSTGGVNPTGSMTEYYLENSYGKVLIKGEVHGWYRMPHTYAYYVDGSTGTGGVFPKNSRGLAVDAVNAAEADGIDFSQFDTFDPDGYSGGDGEIDGLMLIHAGPGYENTGDVDQIGSHMTTLGGNSLYYDFTTIDAFTVQPEEYALTNEISPIGVFCHEFGHVLGLPDLYEIDYNPATADGIGIWSLMASGNYKGDAKRPSHFDPWCKSWLGFVTPILITENLTDVEIPQIETNPIVYKLDNYNSPSGHFLIENRQSEQFDSGLPGSGLIIYHVNNLTWGNDLPTIYNVAVEQADGSFDLEESYNNNGDGGDVWPGTSNNRSFDDRSVPSSRNHSGGITEISVWNISDSDSLMTANFDINWSRPYFDLDLYSFNDNDGDGNLEAGESVEFVFDIYNYWMTASNATITLSSSNPDIIFDVNTLDYSTIPGDGGDIYNGSTPFIFTMPDTIMPTYDSFFVTIVSDDGEFTAEFGIEQVVGTPQVLVVDDDRWSEYEDVFNGDLYNKLIPADQWDTQTSGSPSSTLLDKYNIVIWFTGDTADEKLSTEDVTAMSNYMDNGGNLFLTGQGIASELSSQNSSFLSNYLKCNYSGNAFEPFHSGVAGSIIGDGISVRYNATSNQEFTKGEYITPASGGAEEFRYSFNGLTTAVSYDGSYKLVFFNFGYEAISNTFSGYVKRDTVLSRILTFFGDQLVEVEQIDDNTLLPQAFSLEQNYPNPFNPNTTIRYSIRNENKQMSRTVLKVYNLLGREVITLVDRFQRTGTYEVTWDGVDADGNETASGIYFYKLFRDNFSETKKMILLK